MLTSRPVGIKTSSQVAMSEAGREILPVRVGCSLGMRGGSEAPEGPRWWTVAQGVHRCSMDSHHTRYYYWLLDESDIDMLYSLFLISLCSKEATDLMLRAWNRQNFSMEISDFLLLVLLIFWVWVHVLSMASDTEFWLLLKSQKIWQAQTFFLSLPQFTAMSNGPSDGWAVLQNHPHSLFVSQLPPHSLYGETNAKKLRLAPVTESMLAQVCLFLSIGGWILNHTWASALTGQLLKNTCMNCLEVLQVFLINTACLFMFHRPIHLSPFSKYLLGFFASKQ